MLKVKRKLRKMPVEKPIKDNVLLFLKLTTKLSDPRNTEDLKLEGLTLLDKLWLEKMIKAKKG